MIKILLIAGARPNFMKIAPIMRALQSRNGKFQAKLIHTGQHYDHDMSDVFFEELEIPRPDYCLEVGSGTHAEQTGKIMVAFEKVCLQEEPALVLVVGDVNSTLACSIVAKKQGILVAHVEAGLRSRDLRMPEEINRLVTDAISDYFFVTEKSGVENLVAEGKPCSRIFSVGHVMIDNLFHQLEKLKTLPSESLDTVELKSRFPNYGLLTLHRPSNVDSPVVLNQLMSALAQIARKLPVIFSVHPRTRSNMAKYGIPQPEGIMILKPQPYMAFLSLLKYAKIVLTDSGGIQEETTALGIPCLTLRENTERPITIEEGTNTLVGTSPERILEETERILAGRGKAGRRPDLWDGRAAERIVEILATHL